MAVKYAEARKFALSLPGVGEEPHFGVPSFRVNKRMLVTVPPGNMLHIFVPDAERDMCLTVYAHCTEKVLWGGKVVGIRLFLDKATRGAAEDLILRAWKYRAGRKELAAYAVPAENPAAKPRKEKAGARKAARASHQKPRGAHDGSTAKTVDAYLADFPPQIRRRLENVRAAILSAAPQAQETISYRIPAYKLEGSLIFFAGFAHHIGLYPAPRSSGEFRDELAAYAGGKGTVQFPHDEPLPLELIGRIVKFRAADNLARAAARKAAKGGKSPAVRAPKKKPRTSSKKTPVRNRR